MIMDQFFGKSFEDPRTLGILGIAAGLLEASGNQPRKVTLGEAIGRGMKTGLAGYQTGKQMQMDQMKEAQLQAQLKKQQSLQDLVMQRLGLSPNVNQGQQALAEGATQGDLGPTVTNAARIPQQGPQNQGQFPFSLNDVTALKTLGGPDLLDLLKYANDGSKKEAGAYYTNPMTGQTSYMPKLPEGSTMGPDGRVVGLPGAAQTNATFKGAEAGAVEGAKAQFDFTDIYDPTTKQMVRVPKARLAQGGGFGGPGGFAVAAPRQADITYDIETAKDAAEQYRNLQNSGMKAPGQIAKYKQLESLLANHEGGKLSSMGMDIAQLGNSLGLKIDKNLPNKEAAVALTNELAISLRDTSSGGGMPGVLSDADRQFLVNSVPNLSQSTQGRRQMVQMYTAKLQRDQDVAGMARKWQQRYGRLDAVNPTTGKSFFDNLQDWSGRNPLFAQ